jgi:hypothetical protein
MKHNFLLVFLSLLTSYSCNDTVTYMNYGEDIEFESTYSEKIENNFDLNNISGEIIDVCPKKGCWMNVKVDTDTIFVKFKDYGFFVPKSGMEGKKAIIQGLASIDTVSVKDLKHYAEDAGKSKIEIEKITSPEIKISFLAEGVIIKD